MSSSSVSVPLMVESDGSLCNRPQEGTKHITEKTDNYMKKLQI